MSELLSSWQCPQAQWGQNLSRPHSGAGKVFPGGCRCHPTRRGLPAQEGEPLQQELAGLLHALGIGAPVFQAVVGEVFEDVQPLAG